MTSEETVTAVYLAMMGHAPDPDGLEWWKSQSIEQLIHSLSETERFRERCDVFANTRRPGSEADFRAAWRLREGRGLSEVGETAPDVLVHEAFQLFPWLAATVGTGDGDVRVIGAYAQQFSAELRDRLHGARCWAGIDDGPAGVDVLIFTGDADLTGTLWAMPQLVTSVRRRILSPLRLGFNQNPDEHEVLHQAQRKQLHNLGFLQVTLMYQRRFTDEIVVGERTQLGIFPGEQVRDSHGTIDPAAPPSATWLVADRVPVEPTPESLGATNS
jgi:hypothetical protein